MNRIEAEIHGKWCDDVVNDIHTNMMKYLLIRTENNELCTNFDDKVIRKMNEVKEGFHATNINQHLSVPMLFAADFSAERMPDFDSYGLFESPTMCFESIR